MSRTRSRLILVAIVAGTALLSVGATAYASESLHAADVSSARNSALGSTATTTPTPTPTSAVTPAVTPAPAELAQPETPVAAAPDVAVPEETDPDASADDGNVVEVRTPNPDAIPVTRAQHEYFYGLVTQCMAEAGFEWHAVWLSTDDTFAGVDMTRAGDVDPDQQAGFTLAMYGDTGGGDYYHWADAGCWGYAVHVTGNDGNN